MLATDPAVIAQGIERAWEQWLLRDRFEPKPHPYVYASAYRACPRRMVYDLTVPDRQPPPDATRLAKYRRGNDRERDLLVDLSRIGRDAEPPFKIIGQQERFELRGRSGAVVLVGKVDAKVEIDDYRAPLEVKSWAPFLVDKIETFEDLFENPWTRGGGYQLLSYLVGHNQPLGFMLLDRSGLPLVLPVALTDANLERMEAFLARAEGVVAHAAAGTLPDFIDDPAECKRCDYYGSPCQPPIDVAGAQVLTDPELEAHLERWHELKPAGKEWQALDIDLKKHLRGTEHALIGHFSLTGRWQKQSRVDLPDDLKKRYTVTEPKGRFLLEIDRL